MIRHRLFRLVPVLACMAILALGGAPGFAAPPEGSAPLFSAAPERMAAAAAEPAVVRSRIVRVDFSRLSVASLRQGPVTLDLNLFPDISFRAVLDRTIATARQSRAWIGRLKGIEGGRVVLVARKGALTGSITLPGAAYRVRSWRGVHLIEEIDANAFPPETDPLPVPELRNLARPSTRGLVAAANDDGSIIDLMVVYTPAARAAAGGTTAMEDLIVLGVTETNLAYENSGIAQRLRLVYTAEVDYTESGSISTDLTRLRLPADGYIDEVHQWRDWVGADLVKLVGDSTAGGCGVAYLMPGLLPEFEAYAFSVTARICISPNYTFGHELGHNMGANHAPDDPTGIGAFDYCYGYKDPDALFRTVMAYNCTPSCPRILHFSSPDVYYEGRRTGTETQNNALCLNGTAFTVANFRKAVF